MQGLHRTCRCAEVTTEMVGKEVTLMGWVAKPEIKEVLYFVDLRDRSGIMQLIFENGSIDEEGFTKAGKLRSEFVIAVTGTVEKRGGRLAGGIEPHAGFADPHQQSPHPCSQGTGGMGDAGARFQHEAGHPPHRHVSKGTPFLSTTTKAPSSTSRRPYSM